jgi:hypothetical protein
VKCTQRSRERPAFLFVFLARADAKFNVVFRMLNFLHDSFSMWKEKAGPVKGGRVAFELKVE